MWLSLPLLVASSLFQVCQAAFVATYKIDELLQAQHLLSSFIIDVALDVDKELLKFYINSKVRDRLNSSIKAPLITDVDRTTNRYTTFHVDIDFMGKTFILKDLRFCDIVAVKNTSALETSVRYPGGNVLVASSSSTELSRPSTSPKQPWLGLNNSSIARRNYFSKSQRVNVSESEIGLIASSNSSVEEIFSNSTGSLVQCPLYQNDSIVIYYQADVSQYFNRLGSYTVKFTVVSNGPQSNIIGGARAYVTPVLQPRILSTVLFFGMLCLILTTNCINYLIIIFSPNQESSNPFLIEASTICNETLLKQLEASINRIVGYFQFALFMAALDLQYPGFLQPLIGQIRWCALMGINILQRLTSNSNLESDNVYITFKTSGLGSLALYSSNLSLHYSWPNFMLCLLVWIAITLVVYQGFIMFRIFTRKFRPKMQTPMHPTDGIQARKSNKVVFNYSLSKNAWALVGHIFRQFLSTFGVPVLVLTFFMLYTFGDVNGKRISFSQERLRINAFNGTIPYDYLTHKDALQLIHYDSSISKQYYIAQIPIGSLVGGCISLSVWIALIAFFIFRYLLTFKNWKLVINPNLRKLYTSVKTVIVWSYFYNEYLPEKVHYAVVDIIYAILLLVVIGLLQKQGTLQVALIIVIQFVQLLLLIRTRPFYLSMNWHSLAWLMPAARLIVAILCIPYIRPLNISEASRTYVAYAQMLIHLLVALVFVVHLFYCLALTGTSFVRELKDKRQLKQYLGNSKGVSTEDFNDGFEYSPINCKAMLPARKTEEMPLSPQSTGADDGEVDYYRAHTEMILQRAQLSRLPKVRPKNDYWEEEWTSDDLDFEQTELRKKQNDYTTREGDRIYHKFFTDSDIDPEIRELWLSRDWNPEIPPSRMTHALQPETTQTNKFAALMSHFKQLSSNREGTKIKGFEVCRPHPIIVKPLNRVENNMDLSSHLSE